MTAGIRILLAAFVLVTLWFIWTWARLARAKSGLIRPRPSDLLVGFGTNFFDALGIGNFAPTTAIFKLQRRMPLEQIPGTLNVGHALPVLVEALIFVAVVAVDLTTLIGMIVASVSGAWLGAGVVSRLSRRAVQWGMGIALLLAAALFIAANLHWLPSGGAATGLAAGRLLLAIAVNFLLGALMTIGVGLYAPCLVLVSLLGMSPLAAFPIMMGSCALLMPAAAIRFIAAARYDPGAALGLTAGGIPGVLIAAFVVKSLPIEWLRWLAVIVVSYAGASLLAAGRLARRRAELADEAP